MYQIASIKVNAQSFIISFLHDVLVCVYTLQCIGAY